ncbi:MAG: aldo/keto reductase [Theionarchaea archaeon]|nr:aldo/keto reductase [Theionarchaea archaeon]
MNYRLCKGVEVSEIGIGCYSLSGVYGKKDVTVFKEMLNRAFELGVNFFDTAEGYGSAESVLGETVKPYREDVLIATKVGVKEGVKPNLSDAYITNACEESLKKLQTDYLDVYQVHFNDLETPVEETVTALENLTDEGKILHYGLGHLPGERVEEYCEKGDVFSILMELSAVARHSRKTLLPLCPKYDTGAIAFSTAGRGLLTGKVKTPAFDPGDLRNIDPLFQRENLQSGLRIVEKFKELGKEYDKTPVQVAVAWVLSQKGIICALTGPSTIPHLEENVGGSGWSLSSKHLQELEKLFVKEDEWLKKEQISSLQKILSHELPEEFSRAFKDLIYVVETSMLLELIEEKEILPVFYELFSLQETQDKAALKPIQKHLYNMLCSKL